MKCSSCGAEVTHSMKFCGECGAAVAADDAGIPRAKVTLDWVKRALEIADFNCENGEDSDGPTLVASHKDRPTIIVAINSTQTLITFMARWTMTKPSWARKGSFLAAVNAANGRNWVASFFSPEPHDVLISTCAMWISENTTMRDVAGYVETFSAGSQNAIVTANLTNFA